MAPGASGVVDAVEAVTGIRMTEFSWAFRVCIATAVTWDTSPRSFVEARDALVTVMAAVIGKALVTHERASWIC